MDAQIANQLKRAEKAYEKWRREVGISRKMAAKLRGLKLALWKTPSSGELLEREVQQSAYSKLQKGRPTREFLIRLEQSLYSSDPEVQSAAYRLWLEITIPFKLGRGRTKLIRDRKKIRDEAQWRIGAGEKKKEVVQDICERTGAKPSYILRILDDRQ
jgi:hypothetical protein